MPARKVRHWRIDAIERESARLIAFLTHLAEIVGPEAASCIRDYSSDVLDTFSLTAPTCRGSSSRALDVSRRAKRRLLNTMTPVLGRSHGIPPTDHVGLKLALLMPSRSAHVVDAGARRLAPRDRPCTRDVDPLVEGRAKRSG